MFLLVWVGLFSFGVVQLFLVVWVVFAICGVLVFVGG